MIWLGLLFMTIGAVVILISSLARGHQPAGDAHLTRALYLDQNQLRFGCPNCGRNASVHCDAAGKQVKCKCGYAFNLPASTFFAELESFRGALTEAGSKAKGFGIAAVVFMASGFALVCLGLGLEEMGVGTVTFVGCMSLAILCLIIGVIALFFDLSKWSRMRRRWNTMRKVRLSRCSHDPVPALEVSAIDRTCQEVIRSTSFFLYKRILLNEIISESAKIGRKGRRRRRTSHEH